MPFSLICVCVLRSTEMATQPRVEETKATMTEVVLSMEGKATEKQQKAIAAYAERKIQEMKAHEDRIDGIQARCTAVKIDAVCRALGPVVERLEAVYHRKLTNDELVQLMQHLMR